MIHLFIFFISLSAKAEYRAYQLAVVNSQTKASRLVEPTTLDHLQYYGYYNIQKVEYVKLISTWMCPGRTDEFEPICPNSRAKAAPLEQRQQQDPPQVLTQPQLTSTSP